MSTEPLYGRDTVDLPESCPDLMVDLENIADLPAHVVEDWVRQQHYIEAVNLARLDVSRENGTKPYLTSHTRLSHAVGGYLLSKHQLEESWQRIKAKREQEERWKQRKERWLRRLLVCTGLFVDTETN